MNPLDPLIFAGNVIDTPWAMGRAALAGRNPFTGVFDVDKRTSGRDMLESWGLLGQNQEGFDAGDVAGFAVEMLDPISLATGMWAPKAIRALKGAKALGSVDEVADVAKAGGALVPRVSEPMLDPAALKPLSAIPAANPALPPTPDVIPLSGPGLPLLNVAPSALGATILGTNDENDPTKNALGLALLGGSVAGALGMSLMRPRPQALRAGTEAAESVKNVKFGKSLWDVPEQEITSAGTSINSTKLPKVFSAMGDAFKPGTTNIDIGGGRFDNVNEFLQAKQARNLVFDPFNRPQEHNMQVLAELSKSGGADTATASNVLNVIAEPTNRLKVVSQAKDALKPGGRAMFSIYEGNKSGLASSTTKGFQLNQPSEFYLPLVESVFGKENVTATKGVIVATKPTAKSLRPPPPPRTLTDYQRLTSLAARSSR